MLGKVVKLYFYLISRCFPKLAAKQATTILFTTNRPKRLNVIPDADELRVLNSNTAVKVWYGEGKTILLLHGWSGAIEQFSALLEGLLTRGYQVVAPMPKGHFLVDQQIAHPGNFIEALSDVLDQLKVNIDVAIGHSMGGSAIALLQHERLAFEKAVLISAPSHLTGVLLGFTKALGFSKKATELLLANADEVVGIPHQELDAAKALPHSAQNTLIIHDKYDREVPFTEALRFRNLNAQCAIFETQRLGHRRILQEPSVVNEVLKFIG